jgi:phosphatidylglycerol lysyltransferase
LEDLEAIYPLEVRVGGHVFAAFASFLLLTLAANLLRRKKLAWLLICLLLAASLALHLLRGVHGLIAALNGGLLLLLLGMGPAFTARSDPPSMRQGLRVLLLALLFTLAYGTLDFYLLDRHFSVHFDWAEAMGQTLAMFFSENNGGLRPLTRLGSAFSSSITSIGLLTLGYAVWMLLRPVRFRAGSTTADRRRARAIVASHARSSLAAFTLLADKGLVFSPSRQSLIAFAARGRGAVALGDPIGPEGDQRAATAAFLEQCRPHRPCPGAHRLGNRQRLRQSDRGRATG